MTMNYFSDAEIDQLIDEDLPYFDITSHSVKVGSKVARISFVTKQNTVICGTEEVVKIFEKFQVTPTLISFSGEQIEPGIKFLEGEGLAMNLLAISNTVANLLAYAPGVETRTKELVYIVKEVSPGIPILVNRKSIPFTRKLTVKAVRIGGGYVQQLGLSDGILITSNHIKFLGIIEEFIKKIPEIKKRAAGKSVCVEVSTDNDAISLSRTEIDILQIDHLKPEELKNLIPELRKTNTSLKIAASGNINQTNVAAFASSGADMLVTSYPCLGIPVDFHYCLEPVFDLY
jgi:molybdenum transport protein